MAEQYRVDLGDRENDLRRFDAYQDDPPMHWSGSVSIGGAPGDVDTPLTIVAFDGDEPLDGTEVEGGEPEGLGKDSWVKAVVLNALKNRIQQK